MKNIRLYIPKVEDYWYEEKIQNDPLTMNYNAGYDVNYFGYHYDTGCIDFPKDKWKDMYYKRIREKRFFAYIKDTDLNQFVGYTYYNLDKTENKYCCGIVIESIHRGKGYSKKALKLLLEQAKKDNIIELYDNFELDRKAAVKLFKELGFEIVEHKNWKKFGKEVEGIVLKIKL